MTITELLRDVIETAGKDSPELCCRQATDLYQARAYALISQEMGFNAWAWEDVAVVYYRYD